MIYRYFQRSTIGEIAGVVCFAFSASCIAQTTAKPDYQAAVWASTCASCHGTDGKATGAGLLLAGRSEEELLAALLAFRDGRRTGTIMHQHAKGYSPEELRRIARYFSKVGK